MTLYGQGLPLPKKGKSCAEGQPQGIAATHKKQYWIIEMEIRLIKNNYYDLQKNKSR